MKNARVNLGINLMQNKKNYDVCTKKRNTSGHAFEIIAVVNYL